MNRDYRLQYNDDLRWHRVELYDVERLANWDKLVWQVAWIIVTTEYGRVSDLKQLESVIKPERQITLLGIEGTRIKAQWTNRMMVTIEDMEFVDKASEAREVSLNEDREQAYWAQQQQAMAPIQVGIGDLRAAQNVYPQHQVNWNVILPVPAPQPFVNAFGEYQQGAAVVDNGVALQHAPSPQFGALFDIPPNQAPPRRR